MEIKNNESILEKEQIEYKKKRNHLLSILKNISENSNLNPNSIYKIPIILDLLTLEPSLSSFIITKNFFINNSFVYCFLSPNLFSDSVKILTIIIKNTKYVPTFYKSKKFLFFLIEKLFQSILKSKEITFKIEENTENLRSKNLKNLKNSSVDENNLKSNSKNNSKNILKNNSVDGNNSEFSVDENYLDFKNYKNNEILIISRELINLFTVICQYNTESLKILQDLGFFILLNSLLCYETTLFYNTIFKDIYYTPTNTANTANFLTQDSNLVNFNFSGNNTISSFNQKSFNNNYYSKNNYYSNNNFQKGYGRILNNKETIKGSVYEIKRSHFSDPEIILREKEIFVYKELDVFNIKFNNIKSGMYNKIYNLLYESNLINLIHLHPSTMINVINFKRCGIQVNLTLNELLNSFEERYKQDEKDKKGKKINIEQFIFNPISKYYRRLFESGFHPNEIKLRKWCLQSLAIVKDPEIIRNLVVILFYLCDEIREEYFTVIIIDKIFRSLEFECGIHCKRRNNEIDNNEFNNNEFNSRNRSNLNRLRETNNNNEVVVNDCEKIRILGLIQAIYIKGNPSFYKPSYLILLRALTNSSGKGHLPELSHFINEYFNDFITFIMKNENNISSVILNKALLETLKKGNPKISKNKNKNKKPKTVIYKMEGEGELKDEESELKDEGNLFGDNHKNSNLDSNLNSYTNTDTLLTCDFNIKKENKYNEKIKVNKFNKEEFNNYDNKLDIKKDSKEASMEDFDLSTEYEGFNEDF